jgi:hypothetical protein
MPENKLNTSNIILNPDNPWAGIAGNKPAESFGSSNAAF